jgi:hypothetical protein
MVEPVCKDVGEGEGGVRLPARSKSCFLAHTGSLPMLNLREHKKISHAVDKAFGGRSLNRFQSLNLASSVLAAASSALEVASYVLAVASFLLRYLLK